MGRLWHGAQKQSRSLKVPFDFSESLTLIRHLLKVFTTIGWIYDVKTGTVYSVIMNSNYFNHRLTFFLWGYQKVSEIRPLFGKDMQGC